MISGWRVALTGAVALMALSLLVIPLVLGAWSAVSSFAQRPAAEQPEGTKEGTQDTLDSDPEDFPLNFGSVGAFDADGRPREIPSLSDMDIISYLQYIPNTDFRCPIRAPDRGLTERVCRSSSGDDTAASYELTVESNAKAVVWVLATARGASDEEAAKVLGEVARLAVGGSGPLAPEAWVQRSLPSGGQYLARGAEVRLYGVQGDRALEIVGAGPPPTKSPNEGKTKVKTDQGKLDQAFDKALSGALEKTDGKGSAQAKAGANPKESTTKTGDR